MTQNKNYEQLQKHLDVARKDLKLHEERYAILNESYSEYCSELEDKYNMYVSELTAGYMGIQILSAEEQELLDELKAGISETSAAIQELRPICNLLAKKVVDFL